MTLPKRRNKRKKKQPSIEMISCERLDPAFVQFLKDTIKAEFKYLFGMIPLQQKIKQAMAKPQEQGTAEEHEANDSHVWMPLFDEVTKKKKCYVCYCGFYKDLNPDERV